ncbi:hypothetical protein DFH08DRAFT_932277 [Mycena albidolilacea]|uniref:Uncharacterized protein n=1 Tax=Mycena albidolilacea TaxID=1033008 RepID=A0AAD7AFY0_9AGAR|nr:hypothetical protein DFH08DRAFT_932277 [Mycena albidolilacea]
MPVSSLLAPTPQPAIVTATKEPRRCVRALRAARMYLPDRVGAKSAAWLSYSTCAHPIRYSIAATQTRPHHAIHAVPSRLSAPFVGTAAQPREDGRGRSALGGGGGWPRGRQEEGVEREQVNLVTGAHEGEGGGGSEQRMEWIARSRHGGHGGKQQLRVVGGCPCAMRRTRRANLSVGPSSALNHRRTLGSRALDEHTTARRCHEVPPRCGSSSRTGCGMKGVYEENNNRNALLVRCTSTGSAGPDQVHKTKAQFSVSAIRILLRGRRGEAEGRVDRVHAAPH